jgi:electron transfer flavoprotein alpha subunit
VAGVEQVEVTRRGEAVTGDSPEAIAAALRERLRAMVPPRAARPPLPERAGGEGPPLWVVCEVGPRGLRPVTAELLAKAAALAVRLGGRVEAVAIGGGREHVAALAAAGADRVLLAESPGLEAYSTEAHAAVLAEAIRTRQPRLVLLGATVRGRDLAPRVAARLGLGLTGDAIELDVDAEGRVRQLKPAFGGAVVAPILSHTRPEMATVRPGVLPAARPDDARRAGIEALAVPVVASRVRVTAARALEGAAEAVDLDEAEVVLGVGRGVGSATAVAPILELAAKIGAGVAATREVTDAGWLPRQHQVGLTGRSIAPRLYLALAVGGAMEHLVGVRRAGVVVAVNKNAKAPILKAADLGVVADYAALLPHLATALAFE